MDDIPPDDILPHNEGELPLVVDRIDDDAQLVLQQNLLTICNAIYGTDFKGIDIAGAVLLTSILGDQPEMYKKYIQERGDNFLEIMESDELLSQMIAAQSCGVTPINTEESDAFEPVISGRSPRAIAAIGDNGAVNEAAVYTNLIHFVSDIRGHMGNLCDLMLELVYKIREQILSVIPVEAAVRARVYDNIDLVRRDGAEQIFPRFSLTVACEKDPLLQTVLVAGRENGMGKVLNTFIFGTLQRHPLFAGIALLKIVEPTESNRLWQVKISVHKNDFVFLTIQILNFKPDFFIPEAQLTPDLPEITRDQDATGFVTIEREESLQLFENLCSLLYIKATSKDFNCFCGFSAENIKILELALRQDGLFAFIRFFLTNLVDAQINVKKKYFIYGLLNLRYCLRQEDYTIETKVYRWLFDQPLPRLTVFPEHSQQNKNVFLYSMRLIERVNMLCENQIRIVMGGGKQYSLFQKALFRFKLARDNTLFFDNCMMTVANGILANNPIPPNPPPNPPPPPNPANLAVHVPDIRYPTRDTLLANLNHRIVKAAADLDASIYHQRGALGSTQCMTVCMLLQLCFKKLIDHLIRQGGAYVNYNIDIGNSCIGNPPTTLSSLRISLNNSYLFYSNLEGEDIAALMDAIGIQLGSQPDRNISSIICPFDLVPKGLMEDQVEHILEAVLLFGGMGGMPPLTDAEKEELALLIGNYCMTTKQGFSSALKGIFDIFYTLFIIENFTNRTLVTQKINKELKRISICAQILYLHYSELVDRDNAGTIQPMLDILRDMISYGYAGNLLNPRHFHIIMQKYVEFIRKLIEFNRLPQSLELNFYCVESVTVVGLQRNLTRTERFFMNLLENSLDLPEFPGDPQHPPPRFPAQPRPLIPANQRLFPTIVNSLIPDVNSLESIPPNVFLGLNCIRPAMVAVDNMNDTNQTILDRLSQNKIYASYRDTENKSNSIVVISNAYQNFLWNIGKRNLIQVGNVRDPDYDLRMFCVDPTDPVNSSSFGLLDVFTANPPRFFFRELTQAIAPCYANREENLLDISDEEFDNIHIDGTRKLQFMFWFITCIFGIKTKSTTKKIISLARTYLNGIREAREAGIRMNQIFGCNIVFPAQPEPRLARVELDGQHLEPNAIPVDFHPDNALYLAYDMHSIHLALRIYRGAEANFRVDPQNYVFIMANTLVVLKTSVVLRLDLIERLTVAFSKHPRGQEYINESFAYMRPILGELRNIILDFCARIIGNPQAQPPQGPEELTIKHFLYRVRGIPNVLTVNPYRPSAHDVSKFVDFEENPQYYRNKWISYFIEQIFNSDVSTVNLFNHMKLFILLFRYLTMLPTNEIDGILIVLRGDSYTKPPAFQGLIDATGLIAINLECELVQAEPYEEDAVRVAKQVNLDDGAVITAAAKAQIQSHSNKLGVTATNDSRKKTPAPRKITPALPPPPLTADLLPPPPLTADVPPPPPQSRVSTRANLSRVSGFVAAAAATAAAARKASLELHRYSKGGNRTSHTRKNKYKRNNKNKNKKHKSSPKYKKRIPSSRSGSQSNRKKSKSKLPHKNVTFKRRRARK